MTLPKLYTIRRYEAGTFKGVKLELLGALINILRCDSPDMCKVNQGHRWAVGFAFGLRGKCFRFG